MSDERPEVEGPSGVTWLRLLVISVVTILVAGVLTMALLIQGFDPVISGFLLAYAIGLIVVRKSLRAGAIVIGLATLGFIGAGAPFFVPSLTQPKSTVEFVLNLLTVVPGVVSGIAAVALLRRSAAAGPSSAARKVLVAGAVVLVAGVVFAAVVRVTLDEPQIQSGDLALAAESIEFAPEDLHANSGEISIVIDNKDLGGHTFTIDELDLDEALPGGISTRLSFDAEPGEYEFYCSIPGHEETMHGTLLVH